jgi:hypothetical protein
MPVLPPVAVVTVRYFIIGTFVVNMSIDRYGERNGEGSVEESR